MIEQQFSELQTYLHDEKGLVAEIQRLSTGAHLVIVKNVQIKQGWNRNATDLLFLAPPGYPAARPDCFWVSPHLRLVNGAMPQSANDGSPIPGDAVQGRPVTWFSWHLQTWDPNADKLATFYSACVQRLMTAR